MNVPPDPDRNRPKTNDLLRKVGVRNRPPDPRGEGRQEQNKSVCKYGWDWRTGASHVDAAMRNVAMLCYTIMPPGRKSNFRAGFRPDSNRESLEIGPSADRRPAGGPMSRLSLIRIRPKFGPETRLPAGSTIA
jgi:hypothetical protein